MSFESDIFLDRMKLKRQLNIWRGLVLLIIITLLWLAMSNKANFISAGPDHLARIEINDIIIEDTKNEKILDEIANNNSVKGVIVYVNSPGGTEVGSEIIYYGLRNIAKNKPVVSVMGTVAASGGYMVAIAADYVFARYGTATGSIGALIQSYDMTNLAEKLGIKFHSFKSGPLKAAPSPYESLTPDATQAIQSLIMDHYNFFVDIVAERRKLPREVVLTLADGRVWTGHQAQKLNLIDAIGGESDALKWLQEKYKLPADLPVRDIKIKKESFFIDGFMTSVYTTVKSCITFYSKYLNQIGVLKL